MTRPDVFLCYAWEDKPLADAVRAALVDLGLEVFQDEPGMRDYDYIPDRIDTALCGCRVLVALYTPAFPGSEFCRQELHFALLRSYRLDRSRARVMALVQGVGFDDVRPARLKRWRLPAAGQPLATTAVEIAAAVRQLADEDPRRLGEAPDPPPGDWWLSPLRDPAELYGRERELWQVHDGLFPDDDPHTGGQVVAVTGPGGIGKTMLAEQYARLFTADFPGGVFVLRGFGSHGPTRGRPAPVRQLRERQVAEITRQLPRAAGPPAGADPGEPVHQHLAQRPPYLWIVDDIPTGIDKATFDALLAPTGNGRTVVTARNDLHGWVPARRQVRLGVLDRSAALAVLTSRWPAGAVEGSPRGAERLRSDRREYRAARRLVGALGGHPLGLTLAAGVAGEVDFAGFDRLRELVSRHDREVLALAGRLQLKLPTDHEANIAATILRSLDRLPEGGRDVLRLASLAAPDPIPQRFFGMVLAEADGVPARSAERRAAAELAAAASRFLAAPSGGEGRWEVHALVSAAVRLTDRDPRRRQRLRSAAVTALTVEIDSTRSGRPPTSLADYLPHIEQLAATMRDEDEWHLLHEAGRIHSELGDSRAALALYSRLYEVCRTRLGEEHLTTLTVLTSLAVAYGLHGEHATARALKHRAHRALARQLGDEHPDTLTAWNNLAVTCDDTGEHQAAAEIFAAVYDIRRRRLGTHHPDTLDALVNYGIAVGRCGRHRDAYQHKREAYEISQALHGQEHPRTLDALNNLAASTLALGDRPGAQRMFQDLCRARRRVLGARADTAGALENLAVVTGDPAEATALYEEAYQIRVSAQGPGHPVTQGTLHDLLAALLRRSGRSVPQTSGPPARPVEVLPAGVQLGEIRLDDERMDERVALLELAGRVYDLRLCEHGADHPSTMTAVCYLAHAHAALGQMDRQVDEAWVLIDDAADGLDSLLGHADPAARTADQLRTWIAGLGAEVDLPAGPQ